MAIIRRDGRTKLMYFPKTASTALAIDSFVVLTSGQLAAATSSSTKLLGVLRKAVASTDTDYASTTLIPVEVPLDKHVEFEATTASAVAADVGNAVDLTDAVTVNRGGTTHHVVTITKVISATKVAIVINALYDSYAGA